MEKAYDGARGQEARSGSKKHRLGNPEMGVKGKGGRGKKEGLALIYNKGPAPPDHLRFKDLYSPADIILSKIHTSTYFLISTLWKKYHLLVCILISFNIIYNTIYGSSSFYTQCILYIYVYMYVIWFIIITRV